MLMQTTPAMGTPPSPTCQSLQGIQDQRRAQIAEFAFGHIGIDRCQLV